MSIKSKGKNIGATNPRGMSIIQYDLNMAIIKEYPTVSDAAIELGISRLTISGALSRNTATRSGFIWRYKTEKKKSA